METAIATDTLREFLKVLRKKRNFNAVEYLEKKTIAINKFFTDNKLDAAVMGVSGGVDSAVVYALLNHAAKQPGSPIKKIVGLIMPILGSGTSNQIEAMNKAKDFCKHIISHNIQKKHGHEPVAMFHVCNLTRAYQEYIACSLFLDEPWGNGQLASIVRTPNLYFAAAQLQQRGYRSIVVGTTNRDEGSYIGFFGKASDAMVDLQPIADIHKSEVYKIARLLDVTKEIINAAPAGDVHDGRNDEEMIGAPYWFLELYLLMKQENLALSIGIEFSDEHLKKIVPKVFEDDMFKKYSKAIEEIHNKNAHKYQVGSPSHFIDVMKRKIEGGWS